VIRLGAAPDRVIAAMVEAVLELRSTGAAAALFRVTLLRRLASSVAAFEASLDRYEAFLDLAEAAARDGRAFTTREFQRLFPRENRDLQLALLPLLLEPGGHWRPPEADRRTIARLRTLGFDHPDP